MILSTNEIQYSATEFHAQSLGNTTAGFDIDSRQTINGGQSDIHALLACKAGEILRRTKGARAFGTTMIFILFLIVRIERNRDGID
jgi:hypothetical protein